jgi:hypothetical protein
MFVDLLCKLLICLAGDERKQLWFLRIGQIARCIRRQLRLPLVGLRSYNLAGSNDRAGYDQERNYREDSRDMREHETADNLGIE